MLRVTVEDQCSCKLLVLEGRLCGLWVEEVRKVLDTFWSDSKPIKINLTSVSGMDSSGRDLLTNAYTRGADLIGSGLTTRAFIEEVALTCCPERQPQ